MEGKESKNCCSEPGQSCGVNVPPNSKTYCKCGPGWTCEIRKIEIVADTKPFYKCSEGCVCEEGSSSTIKETSVETEGAYCICEEGFACTITKTEGIDAGKIFCECGNGFSCQINTSGDKVIFKDA